jgi:hypothetical protein
MDDGVSGHWSNHDITSDGRIVEECVGTADSTRRITWYDHDGRVARRVARREIGETASGARRGMTA